MINCQLSTPSFLTSSVCSKGPAGTWRVFRVFKEHFVLLCDRFSGVSTSQEAFFPKGLSDEGSSKHSQSGGPSPSPHPLALVNLGAALEVRACSGPSPSPLSPKAVNIPCCSEAPPPPLKEVLGPPYKGGAQPRVGSDREGQL